MVVSQLHRSPGIDFVSEMEAGERRLFSCRVIPERGSWIEINTTKKDSVTVRIDQSGKFSVITLSRAMYPQYGLDADILRTFYETIKQKISDGRSAARSKARSRSATSSIRSAAIGLARFWSKAVRRSQARRKRSAARA